MTKKDTSNKRPIDFDSVENPVSELDAESLNPDAWVKPEMLRRVSDRNFNNLDDQTENYE